MSALFATLPDRGAVLSPCERYRYRLWRRWARGPTAVFIMLNPSTADAVEDDPTLRRCIDFARRWGCGELQVVNLFGLRSSDPDALLDAPDPIGPDNDAHLMDVALGEALVVAAWGAHRAGRRRGRQVAGDLARWDVELHALGTCGDGSPVHPLYQPASAALSPWRP